MPLQLRQFARGESEGVELTLSISFGEHTLFTEHSLSLFDEQFSVKFIKQSAMKRRAHTAARSSAANDDHTKWLDTWQTSNRISSHQRLQIIELCAMLESVA